ncbi:MAG TPA: alpha/beta hydrolase [Rhizomicrobium sp.]
MDRREALGLVGAVLLSGEAHADTMAADGSLPGDSKEFVPLWPGTPPGGEGIALTLKITDAPQPDGYHVRAVSQIQAPGFFVYRAAKPNGLGLLVLPGGGYASEGGDRGGREIGQHFSALGITCFVLRYRLPGEGWKNRSDVPLQDAQRAMRLIRRDAAKYGINPTRLAAIGFSAGGHLSASLATRHAANVYTPVDGADALDAAPIVAAHLYPVITMAAGAHQGSVDKLLGPNPAPDAVDAYSVERHIAADTVPSFIALAADDDTVPPFPNGITFFGKLREAKIASELHVFEVGGHGFSLHWTVGKPCAAWPGLFLAWAATHGFKV